MAALTSNGSFQDASAKYLGCCATYHDLMMTANSSFGANCWSHSITRQDIDFIDVDNDKYTVGAVAFVKVQIKDGIYHEEMGYGMCSHVANKGLAILTARKEAAKNAFKEALQSFGGTVSAKINEVDARDEQMPHGMSLIWSVGNSTTSKLQHSPVLNRSTEKPIASKTKISEQTTPVKKTNNLTEEDRRRQERIDRQRQKQEEFRKKLKQNEFQKCDVPELTNWDDDYLPGDSFVSMPDEQLAAPLSSAAPYKTAHANNVSPTEQENRVVINQNRRTPLGIKRNMSMGLVNAMAKQNRM